MKDGFQCSLRSWLGEHSVARHDDKCVGSYATSPLDYLPLREFRRKSPLAYLLLRNRHQRPPAVSESRRLITRLELPLRSMWLFDDGVTHVGRECFPNRGVFVRVHRHSRLLVSRH